MTLDFSMVGFRDTFRTIWLGSMVGLPNILGRKLRFFLGPFSGRIWNNSRCVQPKKHGFKIQSSNIPPVFSKPPNIKLVGGWPTPLKNISQLGLFFPICGKMNNVPNHQSVGDGSWFNDGSETIYMSRRQNQLLMLRKHIRDYSW